MSVILILILGICRVNSVVYRGNLHEKSDDPFLESPSSAHTNQSGSPPDVLLNFREKAQGQNEDDREYSGNSERKGGAGQANTSDVTNRSGSSSPILLDSHTFSSEQIESSGGTRNSSLVKRTIQYPLDLGGRNGPFCYDRYVTGNCRYRTDPEYCFQYEWTAYAIVENLGGGVRSEPPGLVVEPGNQERVRVWIKTSCCTFFVKVISLDNYNPNLIANECLIDIRELQGLHPAEIAGIVIGVLLVLILIIVAVVLLIRRRNTGVATVDQHNCQVKSYGGYSTRPSGTASHTTSRIK